MQSFYNRKFYVFWGVWPGLIIKSYIKLFRLPMFSGEAILLELLDLETPLNIRQCIPSNI